MLLCKVVLHNNNNVSVDVLAVTIVGSAINLAYPVARTFMSKMVQPDEQGVMMAIL